MIKIVSGKLGYYLKVDGMYIHRGSTQYGGYDVKAIKCALGIPAGATEFVSVKVIRQFWNAYRPLIVGKLKYPYASVWGQLVPIEKPTGIYL